MTFNPPNGVRVLIGDTFALNYWANAGPTRLRVVIRVLYDDGRPDFFVIEATSFTTTRAAVTLYPGLNNVSATGTTQVTYKDGYVVSVDVQQFGTLVAQRGQFYVALVVAQGSFESAVLTQGYVYAGVDLRLGTIIEPGPAGGAGMIKGVTTADPGAGAEVSATVTTVPTGAVWLLRTYTVQLVQGITQTPLPTLRKTGVNGVDAQIPITGTAIGASSTAQLTWGIGLVQTSFTAAVGDEFHTAPLPIVYMVATEFWATVTDGIGANTNYGAAVAVLEEWVVPN